MDKNTQKPVCQNNDSSIIEMVYLRVFTSHVGWGGSDPPDRPRDPYEEFYCLRSYRALGDQ